MSYDRTKPVLIERPDGNIPGLTAVNEMLSKSYGVRVTFVIQERDDPYTLQRVTLSYDGPPREAPSGTLIFTEAK